MPQTYLVYCVYAGNDESDERTVTVCASNKMNLSLGYVKKVIYLVKNAAPSTLLAKIEEEIRRNMPELSPTKRIDRPDNPHFKQLEFRLEAYREVELFNSFRKGILPYLMNYKRKEQMREITNKN
jgi:hypothetical protein